MIDIVMPCFNSEDTIVDVLDGILAQKFQDFKLYIVDNASNDNTLNLIKSHPIYEKTVLINNPVNIGFVRNVRRALSCGDNPFTALCSSNDTLYPEYLSELLSLHDERTSLSYAISDFYVNDRLVKKWTPEDFFDTTGLSPVHGCERVIKKFTYSSPFWGLYSKVALAKMSPFSFHRGADHVFVAEAALYGAVRMARKNLFKRRYPVGRTLDNFALMENDRQLSIDSLRDTFGWHRFPYVSMVRSHHNMVKRSFVSDTEKEELIKSSTLILAKRFGEMIIKEMKEYVSMYNSAPSNLLDRQCFYEIKAYMDFMQSFMKLEKKNAQ